MEKIVNWLFRKQSQDHCTEAIEKDEDTSDAIIK